MEATRFGGGIISTYERVSNSSLHEMAKPIILEPKWQRNAMATSRLSESIIELKDFRIPHKRLQSGRKGLSNLDYVRLVHQRHADNSLASKVDPMTLPGPPPIGADRSSKVVLNVSRYADYEW